MNSKPALCVYVALCLAQGWGVMWYAMNAEWIWMGINAIGAAAWAYNAQRAWAAPNQWSCK